MSEDDTVGDVMELVMFFPSHNLLMSQEHTVLMVGARHDVEDQLGPEIQLRRAFRQCLNSIRGDGQVKAVCGLVQQG